ncbi:hypothetical protein PHYBLDRAFT_73964 [Phycomyces blakesleeanus NRRL 1555(-)]|uniref:Endonuclease/exonuclease/phosphatase domain-containing protein n=1 Tax=Phycomyces blakesleeanus (strain ATCC 8743b / DSM 1359 / FGSC 10004 / NBRC 33097 / NRRL 1555) TaxID=763407 RepID=A0A167QU35_PHYB8|nr:hypothetical protein PHYBLDRAFT_73964 [Phycomyces blakesleeanus NRRL 1555(-)]OAD80277.1 hypothetical protein PHYBLDRAFT_73964 [Phycomyces blakesleeanus NRRL 1555(-)]|eukprot:XP_018298317.1 hypothetical protein PHYBLDRAFT_73964 [Phycomyces blakesleeanus NRRL 1555(-)]
MIRISTIDDIVPLLKMIYHKNCDDIGSIIYIFGTFDPDEITLFFQYLTPCIPTYISFRNNYEISSIIDLFITNMPLINPSLHIATDLSLGSDHRLLLLSFTYDLQHSTNMPPLLRKTWNLSRLNEPDVHALYAHIFTQNSTSLLSTLQEIVQNLPLTRPNIDAITDEFNSLIYDSLNSSIGH